MQTVDPNSYVENFQDINIYILFFLHASGVVTI